MFLLNRMGLAHSDGRVCACFRFIQRNCIVYTHLLSCEVKKKKKKLSIMRWQLIACLQRYSDFVILELRVQRYRVECCAEKLCL